MGVHGLWQILESTGKTVTLESLDGKVLAIDISMWLHQSVKGMRDRQGNAIYNAHLQFLFNRICKLMYYRIKPVFVFDGEAPAIKRQTLAARRLRREAAASTENKATKRLLNTLLKKHAVSSVLGTTDDQKISQKKRPKDLFELPELPVPDRPSEQGVEENLEEDFFQQEQLSSKYQALDDIDMNSEDFQSLPLEVQHEILTEMKVKRKRTSWAKIHLLPKDSKTFSEYQIEKLMKQNRLSSKIESVRKEMNVQSAGDLAINLPQGVCGASVEGRRLAGDESAHYVLITGLEPRKLASTTPMASAHKTMDSSGPQHQDITTNNIANMSNSDQSTLEQQEEIELTKDVFPSVLYVARQQQSAVTNNNVNALGAETTQGIVDQLKREGLGDSRDHLGTLNDGKSVDTVLSNQNNSAHISVDIQVTKQLIESGEQQLLIPDKSMNLEDSTDNLKHNQHLSGKLKVEVTTRSEAVALNGKANVLSSERIECGQDVPRGIALEQTTVEESPTIDVDSSSDDGDLLEVSNDPTNLQPDTELFPVSIFHVRSPVEATVQQPTAMTSSSEPEAMEDTTDIPSSQPGTVWDAFGDVSDSELLAIEEALETEVQTLRQEKGQQDRLGRSITDQMYQEAQELLRVFGLPFVLSPSEAEAQCAFLDVTCQTDGSVTDDSDVWLFGGQRVYRNFFSQHKAVQLFETTDIVNHLNIDRDKMIQLAYLCGSDYTPGIEGIGPVTALETLLEFPGESLVGLSALKTWWDQVQQEVHVKRETKLKNKLRNHTFPAGFPNSAVWEAYYKPLVDESQESFEWGTLDLDLIRDYAFEKLGWNKQKIDETVLPVFRKLNETKVQPSILQYFSVDTVTRTQPKSKRVQQAISRLKVNQHVPDEPVSAKGKSSKRLPAKRSKKTSKNITDEVAGTLEGGFVGVGRQHGDRVVQIHQVRHGTVEVNLSESSSDESEKETCGAVTNTSDSQVLKGCKGALSRKQAKRKQ